MVDLDTDIRKFLLPNKKMKVYFNENNPNNGIYHISAVVDDDYIVVRRWRGDRWCYGIEHIYYFNALRRDGVLSFQDEAD